MHFPVDYPRINQFQQWYTLDISKNYSVKIGNQTPMNREGKILASGLTVNVKPNETLYISIY
jgi:hypothetical protein